MLYFFTLPYNKKIVFFFKEISFVYCIQLKYTYIDI